MIRIYPSFKSGLIGSRRRLSRHLALLCGLAAVPGVGIRIATWKEKAPLVRRGLKASGCGGGLPSALCLTTLRRFSYSSTDKADPFLLARLGLGLGLRRQLQHAAVWPSRNTVSNTM